MVRGGDRAGGAAAAVAAIAPVAPVAAVAAIAPVAPVAPLCDLCDQCGRLRDPARATVWHRRLAVPQPIRADAPRRGIVFPYSLSLSPCPVV